MVKIRLMRIGTKGRPFYRVVAVDERKKRTGQYIELLGTYNPLTEPHEIILKQDRIDSWVKNGAILSDGYLRITKQAPQRPPRKPKKEKTVKEPVAPVKEEKPVEQQAGEPENNEDANQPTKEAETTDTLKTESAEVPDSTDTPTTETPEGQDPQSEPETENTEPEEKA